MSMHPFVSLMQSTLSASRRNNNFSRQFFPEIRRHPAGRVNGEPCALFGLKISIASAIFQAKREWILKIQRFVFPNQCYKSVKPEQVISDS